MDQNFDAIATQEPPTIQRFGSLVINRGARLVTIDGRPIALSRTHYEILSILAASPREAISSRSLLGAVWNIEWKIDIDSLHVHVSRLRRKLGETGLKPRHIIAVRGYGYRFEPHPEGVADEIVTETTAATPSVQALISANRTLLWLSDNVTTLLGVSARDLQGRNVCSLVHPDDLAVTLAAADQASTGAPVTFMWRPHVDVAPPTLIHALVRPVIDDNESVRAYLAEWHPLTREVSPGAPSGDLEVIRLDP